MIYTSVCLQRGSCSLGNAAADLMSHPRGGLSAHRRTKADRLCCLSPEKPHHQMWQEKTSQFMSEGITVQKCAMTVT